jgi:hypothetical protein
LKAVQFGEWWVNGIQMQGWLMLSEKIRLLFKRWGANF